MVKLGRNPDKHPFINNWKILKNGYNNFERNLNYFALLMTDERIIHNKNIQKWGNKLK